MATTTLTFNPQTVTVPANTNEHDIDFSNVIPNRESQGFQGYALLERVSGTSVQFSNNAAIATGAAALTSTVTKLVVPLLKGKNLRFKGGAGSEVFNISVVGK